MLSVREVAVAVAVALLCVIFQLREGEKWWSEKSL